MNYIQNDRGETVIAVGAPYSIARVRVQYPRLIGRLNSLYYEFDFHRDRLNEVYNILHDEGFKAGMERDSIIACIDWWEKASGSQ